MIPYIVSAAIRIEFSPHDWNTESDERIVMANSAQHAADKYKTHMNALYNYPIKIYNLIVKDTII